MARLDTSDERPDAGHPALPSTRPIGSCAARTALGCVLLAVVQACGPQGGGGHSDPPPAAPAAPSANPPITIELRTTTWFTYPCLQCHAHRAPNPNPRTLTEFHGDKKLKHGTDARWCYRCHAPEDQGQLILIDGNRVGFDQSPELCGSCHGDKMRDWRTGIHGLQTGYWNGPKVRRACTACHDPHSPRFAPMVPEPPPNVPVGGSKEDHGDKDGGAAAAAAEHGKR